MVQSYNGGYGTINKVGTTGDGRVIYQVNDPTGRVAGRLSVPVKDCDSFEYSYKQVINAAPKLQEYMNKMTPEKMKKKQKRASWTVGILGALGAGIPIYLTRNLTGGWKLLKQTGAALGGAIVGLGTGIFVAKKALTPPGAKEIAEAQKNLEKIDIRPVE